MHFLIDANLPRSLAPAVRRLGHGATDVRDIGLTSAPDSQIASYAKNEHLALITLDRDFGDIRNYNPADYAGIVVINVPSDTPAKLIVAIVEGFLGAVDLLQTLPKRLAILEPGRVRFRKA